MNSRVAERSTWKIKYSSDASVLYVFLTLDISGINDIRLINCLLYTNICQISTVNLNKITPTCFGVNTQPSGSLQLC